MVHKRIRCMKLRNTIALTIAAFLLILGFQNCQGQSDSTSTLVTEGNEEAFLKNLKRAYSVHVESPDCQRDIPSCQNLQKQELLSCLKKNAEAFYDALSCEGFAVIENEGCYVAVSNLLPHSQEYVNIDATCFYDESGSDKVIELSQCYGEEVGFKEDQITTGMHFTSWIELENKTPEKPFSRAQKSVIYSSLNQEPKIRLGEIIDSVPNYTDACGSPQSVAFFEESDLWIEVDN